MRGKIVLLSLFYFILLSGCSLPEEKLLVDSIAIRVDPPGRIFSFTNKAAGQYSGQTHSPFQNGWEGWIVREQKVFSDYKLFFEGTKTERSKCEAVVTPYNIIRKYPGNISEELIFPDSTDEIFIKTGGAKLSALEVNGILIDKLHGASSSQISFYLKIGSKNNLFSINSTVKILSHKISGDNLKIIFDGSDDLIINFSLSGNLPDRDVEESFESFKSSKRNRINQLLTSLSLETNNPEFTKATLWAVASLDALITRQQVTGIFAGLPWFNNYWGRDTFISLPGATFVTGNFKDAREVLLNFAKYQDTDPSSKYFGRIPNRITLNETIYNTVDGTPWFVIQAYNYYKYSADLDFLKRIYPQVKLAYTTGAARTDNSGFLRHEDAETWMDAVGPAGPWSPRGDRGVDIQALWFRQLLSTADIADLMGDSELSFRATNSALLLKKNFSDYFIDKSGTMIYDRLQPDGAPDKSVRPNLFFALNESSLIDDYKTRISIISNAMKELVLPYGVLSLGSQDENFHPFHEYPPYYPKDAAYHNGIIWQWNTGPVVQSLCGFGMQDTAWNLTKELTNQILNRGAVGTLAELAEAFPREGEKDIRLSGTFSQAWSLAEYIRNFYQDYLGVAADAPRKSLYLIPSLPAELNKVSFNQKIGRDEVRVSYIFNESNRSVVVEPKNLSGTLDLGISLMNKAGANYLIKTGINQNEKFIAVVPNDSKDSSDLMTFKNDRQVDVTNQFYLDPAANSELYGKIKISREPMRKNIKSLRPPDYALLKSEDIKRKSKGAKVIISKNDPLKDEKYLYPSNTNFAEGILDIEKFTISESKDDYHFIIKMRNLNNPGWHPEYGFQLTMLNICIQNNINNASSGEPGENSMYKLEKGRHFNRKIVIGGGFEVKDEEGKIVAAYIPQKVDVKNPLGNSETNIIEFSLAKKLIGVINPASVITILCGAQDDHGGAGVGVFRSVNSAVSEWNGGGKSDPSWDNVYDYLKIN